MGNIRSRLRFNSSVPSSGDQNDRREVSTPTAQQDSRSEEENPRSLVCAPILDELPTEIHEAIIRFCSARPYSKTWRRHVDSDDVINLLLMADTFSDVALASFQHLACKSADMVHPDSVVVDTDNAERRSDMQTLLFLLGSQLETLVLAPVRGRPIEIPALPHLRALVVDDEDRSHMLRKALRACGGPLESLAISGVYLRKSSARAISTHCVRLRSLTLDYGKTCSLTGVWKAVGATLTHLGLSLNKHSVDIEEIAELCSSISEIDLITVQHPFVFDLAVLLGPRLKVFRMTELDDGWCYDDQVIKVAESCPNAGFHVSCTSEIDDVLCAIGSRLKSLSTCLGVQNFFTEELCTILDGAKIEKLYLAVFVSRVGRFFGTPRPDLKTLILWDCEERSEYLTPFFSDIAASCQNLEQFSIHAKTCFMHDSFEQFGRLAKSLVSVYLNMRFRLSDIDLAILLAGFCIRDLGACPTVQDITIDCDDLSGYYSHIAEECSRFRKRDIGISVGGFIYNS